MTEQLETLANLDGAELPEKLAAFMETHRAELTGYNPQDLAQRFGAVMQTMSKRATPRVMAVLEDRRQIFEAAVMDAATTLALASKATRPATVRATSPSNPFAPRPR